MLVLRNSTPDSFFGRREVFLDKFFEIYRADTDGTVDPYGSDLAQLDELVRQGTAYVESLGDLDSLEQRLYLVVGEGVRVHPSTPFLSSLLFMDILGSEGKIVIG